MLEYIKARISNMDESEKSELYKLLRYIPVKSFSAAFAERVNSLSMQERDLLYEYLPQPILINSGTQKGMLSKGWYSINGIGKVQ